MNAGKYQRGGLVLVKIFRHCPLSLPGDKIEKANH